MKTFQELKSEQAAEVAEFKKIARTVTQEKLKPHEKILGVLLTGSPNLLFSPRTKRLFFLIDRVN
jgi:hypothetical protein